MYGQMLGSEESGGGFSVEHRQVAVIHRAGVRNISVNFSGVSESDRDSGQTKAKKRLLN